MDSFHVSEFVEWGHSFTLTDYQGNKYIIKSETYKDDSPMLSIALYTKYIISNQTQSPFDIFLDNHWTTIPNEGYTIAHKSKFFLCF